MKGDEFKIILEDINEKFDVIIEGHKLLNENLIDRLEKIERNIKRLRMKFSSLEKT